MERSVAGEGEADTKSAGKDECQNHHKVPGIESQLRNVDGEQYDAGQQKDKGDHPQHNS